MAFFSRRFRSVFILTLELLLLVFLLNYLLNNSRYAKYKSEDLNSFIDTLQSSMNLNGKKGAVDFSVSDYLEAKAASKSPLTSEEIKKLEQMDHDRKEKERIKENDKLHFEKLKQDEERKKTEEAEQKVQQEQLEKQKVKERRRTQSLINKHHLQSFKKEEELKLDMSAYGEIDPNTIDIPNGFLPFQDLMHKFVDLLVANKQSFPHPERIQLNDGKPIIWRIQYFEHTEMLTESELGTLLDFSDEFIDDLIEKHFNIVKSIPDKMPVNFYKGKGYVIVGGGKYSWFALLSIKHLRDIGSTLPIEVFIPNDDEWENDFCNVILPSLNSRCVMMSQAFGPTIYERIRPSLSGYQYKSFALLASSFKDAFLLDSDSIPLVNPDSVFESSLYKNFKMVTWPDFWRRTVSPHYYEIAGIEVGNTKSRSVNDFFTPVEYISNSDKITDPSTQLSLHDRQNTLPDWSSESGQLLIDKEEHFNTLLLSLYYNYDGPYGYHPLLSQGGAGEGDKETFCAAATYYKKPFYQLYKAPDRKYGYYNRRMDGYFEHSTIAQYDPLVDFDILVKNVHRVMMDIKKNPSGYDYSYLYTFRFPWNPENCQPMFYHVHDPKYDPFKIIKEEYNVDMQGNRVRNLGVDLHNTKTDIELYIWELMDEFLCDSKDSKRISMKFFNSEEKQQLLDKYCKEDFKEQIAFLKKTGEEIVSNPPTAQGEIIPGVSDLTSAIDNSELSMEEYTEVEEYIFQRAGIQPPYHFKYENQLKLKESEKDKKASE